MIYYHKINSPFKRERGKFTSEFADIEFAEYLHDDWNWYFKWDGMNVGVDLFSLRPFGRTKNSAFTYDQWRMLSEWALSVAGYSPRGNVYGELVGPGIQSNPHKFESLRVMEFERVIDGEIVLPEALFTKSLDDMIQSCMNKDELFQSSEDNYIEGYVGRLAADPSIITKLKVKDQWA